MRGIPGSGKSVVAKNIARQNGKVHSINDHFYDKHGTYKWDQQKHKDCVEKTYLEFIDSIKKGIEVVVLDNANIYEWEYARYITAAREEGYIVSVVTMPHPDISIAEKNTKIEKDVLEDMVARWEPFKQNQLEKKSKELKGNIIEESANEEEDNK